DNGECVKREAVAHLRSLLGLSERRACRIAGADRKMVRYQAQRAPDTELRGRLRELANERRRFGYRRLFVLARAARASGSGSTGSIGSTAKKA
ncbi:transposase, partial [Thioclava atlantica]